MQNDFIILGMLLSTLILLLIQLFLWNDEVRDTLKKLPEMCREQKLHITFPKDCAVSRHKEPESFCEEEEEDLETQRERVVRSKRTEASRSGLHTTVRQPKSSERILDWSDDDDIEV